MKRQADLTKSQLFLGDLWIDEQHKLTRLWHAADIYPKPVLVAEKPWEGTTIGVLTVMKSGDLAAQCLHDTAPRQPPLDGGGAIQVAVWDESGQPIEGFAGDAAAPFDRNVPTRGAVEPAVVRWPGDRSLDELAGRRIRLNFLMRDSHLFSFRSSGRRVS